MQRGCFDESQANHRPCVGRKAARKQTAKQLQQERHKSRVAALCRMEYAQYLESSHWQKKRRQALAHYRNRCCSCGATDRLHVHHVSYKRRGFEKMADLRVLCADCHAMAHPEKTDGIMDSITAEFLAVMG